ncbi:MAG: ABC transporter permease subunit [Candidatus Thorarchaeota archaeon]
MNINHVRALVEKDFNVFMKKKSIIYAVVILPLAFSIGMPALLIYIQSRSKAIASNMGVIISSFSYLFVVLGAIAPIQISSYSLVGEKVEKCIEPLLATPLTDSEILLSKSIIAFFPSLIALYISASIFTVLVDSTIQNLGENYLPDWSFTVILLIILPLTLLFSIEIGIIVSSQVNDARSASQLGMVFIIPLFAIFLLKNAQIITFDQNTLLIIAGVLIIGDIILFVISRILFRREQILTKWK